MTTLLGEDPKPFWLAGRACAAGQIAQVRHPGDASPVASYVVPGPEDVEQAVTAAWQAREQCIATPAWQRAAALDHVSAALTSMGEEVARLITSENGKPIRWARAEVARAASTFRWAAEEARRFGGELQRLDTDPASAGRSALIRRFPKGPVLGISPFNFPLNLVAHKIAPAIAVGAPVIVKPSPKTPLSALLLGQLLAQADLPAGSFSVLPVGNDAVGALVTDPRLPVVSFTGSDTIGFAIQDAVPRKTVILELGGNAAAVVCADFSAPADQHWAAARIATFANYQAGQSCISVQRVIVDEAVYDDFVPLLISAVRDLADGPVWDDDTVVGPLIDDAAADRVEAWIGEAVAAGARCAAGGTRSGRTIAPTVLLDAPDSARVVTEEVFGPVLAVQRCRDIDAGLDMVNASRFGLQAGVFTHDLRIAFRAMRELEVGGVIIGDVPSYRADQMPYGGVKDSGGGREGVRSAMADFTYERVMVLTGVDL